MLPGVEFIPLFAVGSPGIGCMLLARTDCTRGAVRTGAPGSMSPGAFTFGRDGTTSAAGAGVDPSLLVSVNCRNAAWMGCHGLCPDLAVAALGALLAEFGAAACTALGPLATNGKF